MIPAFDQKDWPFEVQIDAPDGSREYSQSGKDNGDGTASFVSWGEMGPIVKTVPIETVTFKTRPWELVEKWYEQFHKIFGFDARN